MYTSFALTIAALTLSSGSLTPSRASAQARCEAPRVMIVVDRSSSMSRARSGALPSGHSKWEAARNAVAELVGGFSDRVDFGLNVYPPIDRANMCLAGAVVVDTAANNGLAVMGSFPVADPPQAGNWTPTAQTLDGLLLHGTMLDPARTRHIVLLTDGEQCCFGAGSACLPEQRFWPVDSVMRLRAMGILVHVIGFGASVDPLALNRMAHAGGTAFPGCDMASENAASPNNCYYQADTLVGLQQAFAGIAREITDEVCDAYDNDCDGLVDEGYDQDLDGYTFCGSDPAMPGTPPTPARADCVDTNAMIHPGATEMCNSVDDNCDGQVDPGCDCQTGQQRNCGMDTGLCSFGIQRCTNGLWSACEGAIPPRPGELCDRVDEDCDGRIDENATCDNGTMCVDGACVGAAPDPNAAAGTPPPGDAGGCACATTRGGPSGLGAFALAGIVAALATRKRARGARAR